jgi:hypothetical protein
VIADNTKDISTFAPYAPTVDAAGAVFFQATLKDGTSAVLAGHGDGLGAVRTVVATRGGSSLREVVSHPAVSSLGTVTFYADDHLGERGAYTVHGDVLRRLVTEEGIGPLRSVGPLGPTMNEAGWIAFRATDSDGRQRVCLAANGRVTTIAETGALFSAFHGLPVVTGYGVVFRGDLRDGTQTIYASCQGALRLVSDTRGPLRSIGRFPSANQEGTIAFTGELVDGSWGIFTAETDGHVARVPLGAWHGALRGALVDGRGRVVFYGSPHGGRLGIFDGYEPGNPPILTFGDGLEGSTVVDFALNPVSINERGQLALRVSLSDGRELVLGATRHD